MRPACLEPRASWNWGSHDYKRYQADLIEEVQHAMGYQIDVLFSLVIWVQKYRQSMHRPNNQRLSSWATNYTWV